MYHFFVARDQIKGREAVILGSDVNHISNVLRMKPGDEFHILDGDGMEYHCRITSVFKDEIRTEILEEMPVKSELPSRIFLFQGFPKGDKLEQIIQKSIELGVSGIIPVMTERSIVRLDEKKAEKRLERYNAIAEAAAKQSRRGVIPVVQKTMGWKEALSYAEEISDRILIPYELAENMSVTREVMGSIQKGETISVFIGPEGGFSPEEMKQAVDIGVSSITLGKRILRTETAGPAVLAMLNYLLEE